MVRRLVPMTFAVAAIALGGVGTALAASFDCSLADSVLQKTVCSRVDLSFSDEELSLAYNDALAKTYHPEQLKAEQESWLSYLATLPNKYLSAAYDERIDELRALADTPHDDYIEANFGSECSDISRAPRHVPCHVTYLGTVEQPGVRDDPDSEASGEEIDYQIQRYSLKDGSHTQAEVAVGGGIPPSVFTYQDYDATLFYPPQLFHSKLGTFLFFPAIQSMDVRQDVGELFKKQGKNWQHINTASWKDNIQTMLPDGLSTFGGFVANYRLMTVTMLLWKQEDAVCCPSGGEAYVRLKLLGNKIDIASVQVEK